MKKKNEKKNEYVIYVREAMWVEDTRNEFSQLMEEIVV